MVRKVRNRAISNAFEAWLLFASERKRMAHLLTKVTGKFRNRAVSGAFEAWVECASNGKRMESLLKAHRAT